MSVSLAKSSDTPRVLSSVTPARYVRSARGRDHYRDAMATEFVSDVAGGVGTGGTYGAGVGRYVVGGWADSVVIRAGANRAARTASALAFVADVPITAHEGIGYWSDSETGRVWLDVVQSFDWRDLAEDAARANGELAYFDRQTGATIYVR